MYLQDQIMETGHYGVNAASLAVKGSGQEVDFWGIHWVNTQQRGKYANKDLVQVSFIARELKNLNWVFRNGKFETFLNIQQYWFDMFFNVAFSFLYFAKG